MTPRPSEDGIPLHTVGEAVRALAAAVTREHPVLRVRGEISNYRSYPSGHSYFTLKDADAQLSMVLFRGDAQGLSFLPAEGQEVEVLGEPGIYAARGQLQVVVRRMQPGGVGELMRAFEALKKRLGDEGLFDADHKVPLPRFPRTIALVTSPQGAAVRDLVHVLRRRWPAARLVLEPVPVQGAGAAERIAAGLERVDRWGGADVIVVGRGGGSLEDLWPFNEEPVARALYACRTPVVSAVGHETDTTISDFVADLRAATPSAAAEIVVPDRREVAADLGHRLERLRRRVDAVAGERRRTVTALVGAYGFRRPDRFLAPRRQELDEALDDLSRLVADRLRDAREDHAAALAALTRHHPRERLSRERTAVAHALVLLRRSAEAAHRRAGDALAGTERALKALDPTAVLTRGYALVRAGRDGRIVHAAAELTPGEEATLQFSADRAYARVEGIESDPPAGKE
jgi:exodeoxyribonuclease VII large subunit